MIITVAVSGCQTDDINEGVGNGMLTLNEHEYSMTGAYFSSNGRFSSSSKQHNYSLSYGGGKHLAIYNDTTKGVAVNILFYDLEFTPRTYTKDEISVIFSSELLSEFNVGDELNDVDDEWNIVMTVEKSNNTYDVTITGKIGNGNEFTLVYTGTIRID